MIFPRLTSTVLPILLIPISVFAAVIHVPGDYPEIQSGIDAAADGDTVLVGDGTYSGAGNTNITWDGNEKHILLISENGSENCIIDCESLTIGFNFSNTHQNELDLIDGFTLRNGISDLCGGMRCVNVSLIISNCVFSGNTADSNRIGFGGAIYSLNSPLNIQFCEFSGNHSDSKGGAFYCSGTSPVITGCNFTGNSSLYGGGLYCSASSPVITQCSFSGNSSSYGGALYCSLASPVIRNSIFSDNTALLGGGIYCDEESSPAIGGSPGLGNTFENNYAFAGRDLCCEDVPETPINTQYNDFSGYPHSDYYVSPVDSFNLNHSTSPMTPVTQDVYISISGDDSNDGLTWATSFRTVQHALSVIYASAGNLLTIHIAPGTYSPSTTGEIYPLPLVEYVSIYGDSEVNTILDAEGTDRVFYSFNEHNLLLSNLTISGGNSDDGAGLYCFGSSPVIQNCIFSGNEALFGGGVSSYRDSSPFIENCTINNNIALIEGGGIRCYCSSPTIKDCIISANSAENGGGVSTLISYSEIENCNIYNNVAESGGGIFGSFTYDSITQSIISANSAENGGGVYIRGSTINFDSCKIENNTGVDGGGVFLYYGSQPFFNCCGINNNTASGNGGGVLCLGEEGTCYPLFTNCTILENLAEGVGGGISLRELCVSEIMNCTFRGNSAQNGGGIQVSDSTLIITNSILWEDAPEEIAGENSDVLITYSDIDSGWSGEGNIDEDPEFIGNGDCHLSYNSPCIDAGTDIGAPDSDIEGFMRPRCGATDMGAYEYDGGPATSRVYVKMPAHLFYPGTVCSCSAMVWNNEEHDLISYPFFVVLSLYGSYYFAPGFSDFDYYLQDFGIGENLITVLPEFIWPSGAGEASGVVWYAGITNQEMSGLLFNLATWEFGWME